MESSSAEHWRAALAHAGELIEQPQDERSRRLEALAREQPLLAARVRALLEADAHAASSGFLDVPDPLEDTLPTEELLQPDMMLGPYRLAHELGRGGMGQVWLARRDDGLYQGEVAIKTLHPHLATRALRERLHREALLLGRLQHPHIARLLDAGTAGQTTYLVLEYVRGEPLEAWCQSRGLDVAARLRLFLDICAAVAHAHANLIVHRDLKPSNVLVTDDGVAKLLDFGIGKLLDPQATQGATDGELTRLTGRALTPDYAAPEQIRGEAVTTVTDVYSLGALLYVLLSGARPFSAPGRSPVEIEHAVLNDEPPSLSRAARAAGAEAAVARRLTGDLEHIVRRAMRKQAVDRYPSVLALADDVRRHLARQPVQARCGSRWYLTWRFVQRHRTAVILGAALAISALVGIGGIVWQSREAREQARIARSEAAKSTAVKEFLIDIFDANNQRHPEGARARLTTAEELLDVAREKILAGDPQDAEVRAELMGIQGRLFLELDKPDAAATLFEARIQLLERLHGARDVRLAGALTDLGTQRLSMGRFDAARELANRARDLLEAHGGQDSRDRAIAEHILGYVSYLTTDRRDDPTARRHFEAEVAILEKLPPSDDLVRALYALGKARSFSGDHANALPPLQRGLTLAIERLGPRDPSVAAGHQVLAAALGQMRRLAEAETHQRQALELFQHNHGPNGTNTSISHMELGRTLEQQGKYRDAVAQYTRGIEIRQASSLANDMWTQSARAGLAMSLFGLGDFAGAERTLQQGLEALPAGKDDNTRMVLIRTRANLRLEQGRPGDALADADTGLALAAVNAGPRGLPVAQFQGLRGTALTQLRRLDDAAAALDLAQDIVSGQDSAAAAPVSFDLRLARARLTMARDGMAQGVAPLTAVLAELRAREDRTTLWPQEEAALRLHSVALLGAGDAAGACTALEAAVTLRSAQSLPGDPRLRWARDQQGRCGR